MLACLYGHLVGDACLKRAAEILSQNLRNEDQVSCFGGEEFLVLLADTGSREAMIVANNLCHVLEQTPISESPDGHVPGVTASIGVASVTCTGGIMFEDLMEMADNVLYAAKAAGKNRACIFP